jgi:hypothetical protein
LNIYLPSTNCIESDDLPGKDNAHLGRKKEFVDVVAIFTEPDECPLISSQTKPDFFSYSPTDLYPIMAIFLCFAGILSQFYLRVLCESILKLAQNEFIRSGIKNFLWLLR